MRKLILTACAGGALAASSPAVIAATANVPFAGLVTATCVLTVGTPGVLAPNTDFTSLNSLAAGGTPGSVAILSTGASFKVSAIAPTVFTLAPPTGGDNVSFASTYQTTGATATGTTPGTTQTTIGAGTTNMTVNLAATKSAGNFTGGAYAAEVIVRCE
ncbi:MAG: hypothetical protein K2X41_10925 [Hyphomicrobium sp.]|nr:hypothetical protein [Hyphomicrobium sp.]